MLHIILLILKILGFLILVLAGLMLVAVITVLFAPAGYRFDLTAEEFGKSILGKLFLLDKTVYFGRNLL